VAELLEHMQIVSRGEVLNDFPIPQAKAVNVLDFEGLTAWRQTGTFQGRNKLKVPPMRSLTSHFAHNQVALCDHQIHYEAQVRKRRAPYANNVLDQRVPIMMLLAKIHEVFVEELADQINSAVVPELFELTADVLLVFSGMPIIKLIPGHILLPWRPRSLADKP
jgi:hypothetical protein